MTTRDVRPFSRACMSMRDTLTPRHPCMQLPICSTMRSAEAGQALRMLRSGPLMHDKGSACAAGCCHGRVCQPGAATAAARRGGRAASRLGRGDRAWHRRQVLLLCLHRCLKLSIPCLGRCSSCMWTDIRQLEDTHHAAVAYGSAAGLVAVGGICLVRDGAGVACRRIKLYSCSGGLRWMNFCWVQA